MSISGYLHRLPSSRLSELLADPSEIEYYELADSNDCTVEKTWNAIEHLLQCLNDDDNAIELTPLTGGVEIGTSLAYGPARYFTSDEVVAIASALTGVSEEMLRAVFDPCAMQADGVYPMIWTTDDADWLFTYVWERYSAMAKYFSAASKVGDAMLVYFA